MPGVTPGGICIWAVSFGALFLRLLDFLTALLAFALSIEITFYERWAVEWTLEAVQ